MVWNVRGLNSDEKQQKVEEAIRGNRVDIAMLTETRLTRHLRYNGLHVEQTS